MADELALRAPERPPLTLPEALTLQFYAWELRGRGWRLWDYPVELEPPFQPFFGHVVSARAPVDDGRRPTALSTFVERLFGTPRVPLQEPDRVPDLTNDLPEIFDGSAPLIELTIALPPNTRVAPAAAEQFLRTLTYAVAPVSFEFVGTADAVTVLVSCRAPDRDHVRAMLEASFPDAVLTIVPAFVSSRWDAGPPGDLAIVDFGLSQEFMRPLRIFSSFETDPLAAVGAAIADLEVGECGVFQMIFQAVRAPWPESILRAVMDERGESFFLDAPDMLALAREKVRAPLFATVIRGAGRSPHADRAWEIVRRIGSALAQLARPLSNELVPLANDGYEDRDHAADLLERRSRRSGMLLNVEEVASLVHLPAPSVRLAKLSRAVGRTKAAPASSVGHDTILGENVHAGVARLVTIRTEERLRHLHVVGASGTGKSTLLFELMRQDLAAGNGFALIDPHGDLVDEVLGAIPEERTADVVLVDPADPEYVVGFNILHAHSELEKTLLSSDLVAVFRRLSTSWGDQMTSVLGNAVLAFLESTRGGTLADLRRFLVEPDFRKEFLGTVTDPEVVYYWTREFPLLHGRPQAPLLTRLDAFLRPKLIRQMVTERENRLDFAALMNEGKVLLVKLAQGAIGEENAALLGTLVVAKLHQLAIGRQEQARTERRPFFLYLDEFQHFVTPSMASILTGARKYGLGLVLAHQELRQLWSRDSDVASAVLSNPATRVCFRVGDEDARKLAEGFASFGAEDLQSLGVGEAICRVERADWDFNLRIQRAGLTDAATASGRREAVVQSSRDRYGARREGRYLGTPAVAEGRVPAGKVGVASPSPPPHKPFRPAPPDAQAPIRTSRPAGRGGAQHKYLQELVKRAAEACGYRASVEQSVLGGMGSIDVLLTREDETIACEIAVNSTVPHEIENIRKCVAAGYARVIALAAEEGFRQKLAAEVGRAFGPDEHARVACLSPTEFLGSLRPREPSQGAEQTTDVRGYRVRVTYEPPGADAEGRAKSIADTILGTLRRIGRDRGRG